MSLKSVILKTSALVLILGILYSYLNSEAVIPPVRIKLDMSARLSVFVLGATGEVGKEVVKELARQGQIERVTLIGRRVIELPVPDATYNYAKFTQTVIDFDKLATDHASIFQGFDVGISTLGTTRGKSGKDGFYKVDHDYVVESATLAKAGGCKHFNLVSSGGANKDAYFFYPKVKGQVEDEITQMGFDRLTIYQPGLLLCDRTESRATEKYFVGIARALDRWHKTSVETYKVAKAIVNTALTTATSDNKVEILDNGAINRLGSEK